MKRLKLEVILSFRITERGKGELLEKFNMKKKYTRV